MLRQAVLKLQITVYQWNPKVDDSEDTTGNPNVIPLWHLTGARYKRQESVQQKPDMKDTLKTAKLVSF